jgi:hypothetical protein
MNAMPPNRAKPERKTTEKVREMIGVRSRSSDRIGSGTRRSTTTNAISTPRLTSSHWARLPASPPTPISKRLMPANSNAAPSQSTRTGVRPRVAGYASAITANANRPSGRLMRNTHRQERVSVM